MSPQSKMLPLKYMGPVVKMGEGDLGGKARVLPFVQRMLAQSGLPQRMLPHTVTVPETWVLATGCFADYVTHNKLDDCADISDDEEVKRRFLAGEVSHQVKDTLLQYLESHTLPLAIRSSALSEDTHHTASAGLFSTYFIPNRGPERFRQLQEAVKLVWASAFFADVGRFLRTHNVPREEGQMAVALETVVGTGRGNAHYPLAGGVAQSVNFFPVGAMKPEDGVVTMVVGLGSRAVSGRDGIRWCPAMPTVRPSLQSGSDIERTAQRVIDAVNLDAFATRLHGDESDTIVRIPIEQLESLDLFTEVASVYDQESGVFYESLIRPGRRMITFNRLLRESSFPLPTVLRQVMALLQEGFGAHVEIEFALDVEGSGSGKRYNLVLLQARPLPALDTRTRVEIPDVPADKVLLRTDLALGQGAADKIRHIVFVDPRDFSLETSASIATEVAALNDEMHQAGNRYLLLGPGRWGSCNRAVGVPVSFRHIDGAWLVAEIATRELAVEPSQGTHFFHNMISRDLFFLTVDLRGEHKLDLEWLRAQPNQSGTRFARLIDAGPRLSVRVDAHRRTGLVYFAE
jgi:hypothetical protein